MSEKPNSGRATNTAGERRRQAILDAAWSLFLEKGYPAVSVDEIISVSGGSKSTVYKFFGNKEGILKVLTESFADDMIREINLPVQPGKSPREKIRRIGLYIGKQILSEYAINHHRFAVCNAKDFPEVAWIWYESGPSKTFESLADFLGKETQAGRLNIKNPKRAALFFLGMIGFKDNMTMLIGADPPSGSELEAIVDEAVDVFMAAYGKQGT